ncbi:MAG: InlB B-repeat-containing protein [Oscillospiraceae bacterium]|nr:InlB B-repeat-containing protein [Candidatus Ruminococcus equi]
MKYERKTKILSMILCVVMLMSAFTVLTTVSAFSEDTSGVTVLSDGKAVDTVKLPQNEKVTLTASSLSNGTYQWQILANKYKDLWTDIYGEKNAEIEISYPMVANVLDVNDTAYVRCALISSDGEVATYSEQIAVKVTKQETEVKPAQKEKSQGVNLVFGNDEHGEISSKSEPGVVASKDFDYSKFEEVYNKYYGETQAATEEETVIATENVEKATQPATEDKKEIAEVGADYTYYQIIIQYLYEDESIAFQPFVATVAAGQSLKTTVTCPNIVGYIPFVDDVQTNSITLDYDSVTSSETITVTYKPDNVKYKVHFLFQNTTNNLYTEDVSMLYTGTGKTNSETPNADIIAAFADKTVGFTPAVNEPMIIAADGSTELTLKYDRNYYLMYFELGEGGYGTESIYARYGTQINVNEPTRAGYLFAYWLDETSTKVDTPKTVPAKNVNYTAFWTATKTGYTIVYWRENANNDNYSFWGAQTVYTHQQAEHGKSKGADIISGDLVDGYDDIPASLSSATVSYYTGGGSQTTGTVNEKELFTYNSAKTDKNVTVKADGSTIVNVYYTRNKYTINFVNSKGTQLYSITAKYEQSIGSLWPTREKEGFSNLDYYDVRYAHMTRSSQSQKSKVVTMTYDWCKLDSSRTITATMTTTSTTSNDKLHYMAESFDQISPESGSLRKKYNNKYYDALPDYEQTVANDSGWQPKTITGLSHIHTTENSREVWFFYDRLSYKLSYVNYNQKEAEKVETVKYGAPLKNYDYTPKYPTTLEPGAFVFDTWYTTQQCFPGSEFDFESETMPAGNVGLFANYLPATHNIQVYLTGDLTELFPTEYDDKHGGHHTYNPEFTVNHGDDLVGKLPLDYQYDGLDLAGWFYYDDLGEKRGYTPEMKISHDMKIFAEWNSDKMVNYEVRYELEDGTEIAESTKGTALAGRSKVFFAKGEIDWYPEYKHLVDEHLFPHVGSHVIVLNVDETKNVFTFVYMYRDYVPYVVRYVEVGTETELAQSKTVLNNTSSKVNEIFVPVDGYCPDMYQKSLTVSIEGPNVLTFYYTPDTQHAIYRIAYYYETLSGEYGELRSMEYVEEVGKDVKQKVLDEREDIPGFSYNESKSVIPPDGTLTTKGMNFEFYYDRNSYDYTVKYLNYDTKEPVQTEKTDTAKFESVVTETAPTIQGLDVVGDVSKDITITLNEDENIAIFYYKDQQVSINYRRVGPVSETSSEMKVYEPTDMTFDGGTLDMAGENITAVTEKVEGSKPTVGTGYRFAGWYTDADCTKAVDSSWVDEDTNKLTPQKKDGVYESATYYALFVPTNTTLKIRRDEVNDDDTFIYHIVGKATFTEETVDMFVTLHGDDVTTVTDVPLGEYTITEQTGWTWRYDTDGKTVTKNVISDASKNVFDFSGEKTITTWISDVVTKLNEFIKVLAN